MSTITFLTSSNWVSSGGETVIQCWGGGGHGGKTGNGGSGGAYSEATLSLSAESYYVQVGNEGEFTQFTASSGVILVKAAGGNSNGTNTHQSSSSTGSIVYIGGHGSPDYTGYASYNGSGGGSSAGPLGNGLSGLSAHFSTKFSGAPGGQTIDPNAGTGGDGAFYPAVANLTYKILPATDGTVPGGGGGGSYDYGVDDSGNGASGQVIIIYGGVGPTPTPSMTPTPTPTPQPIIPEGNVLNLDAASISLPDMSGISYWEDSSPYTNSLYQVSSDLQPIYKSAGGPNNLPYVVGDGIDDNLVSLPNSSLELTHDMSFVSVVNVNQTTDPSMIFAHSSDNLGYALRMLPDGNTCFYRDNGMAWAGQNPPSISDGWHIASGRFINGFWTLFIDGLASSVGPTLNGPSQSITSSNDPRSSVGFNLFSFGGAPGTFTSCSINAQELYDRGLTPHEMRQRLEYHSTRCSIPFNPGADTRNYILFDGNSIVYGLGSSDPTPPVTDASGNDVPSQVIRMLGGTGSYAYENGGAVGILTKQLISGVLTPKLKNSLSHIGNNSIVYICEGINDLANVSGGGDMPPSASIAYLEEYCSVVRAMLPETKIIVGTITPFNNTQDATYGTEENRQLFNTLLRAVPTGTYWDAVADIGADPTIGASGSNLNPTYFADGTHLTNAGYTIMAGIVYDTIQTVL